MEGKRDETTNCPRQFTRALYDVAPADVLDVIHSSPAVPSVLPVGHEPTWSAVAGRLIGGGHLSFAVGACARIDTPVSDWLDLAFGDGRLQWLAPPALLR